VQKIIKASFCPKEKWIRDEDAINCFKCDKKFHSLYRRKHHCRYCGQVFCATQVFIYLDALIFTYRERTSGKAKNLLGCVKLASRSAGNISPSMMIITSNIGSQATMKQSRNFREISKRYRCSRKGRVILNKIK